MKITDADALGRLGQIEGEEWREAQSEEPCGFMAWLAAWRDAVALCEALALAARVGVRVL
jgi:hypothetical protein